MKLFVQVAGFGIAGVIALTLLSVIVVPLMGLLALAVKVALVVAVGWFVLRLLDGRRKKRV